jgi:hypothetical protein
MSAVGVNDEGSEEAIRESFRIAQKYMSANIGDLRNGNIHMKNLDVETFIKRATDRSIVHIVFSDKSEAFKCIRALKEADLGISVVLSGLFTEIFDNCKKIAVTPHTVHYSLGVFGKTDLLPDEDVLSITTMCGHHQVSHRRVEKIIEEVRKQKKTIEEAGRELAQTCVCGVFNPKRAEQIIKKIVSKS